MGGGLEPCVFSKAGSNMRWDLLQGGGGGGGGGGGDWGAHCSLAVGLFQVRGACSG